MISKTHAGTGWMRPSSSEEPPSSIRFTSQKHNQIIFELKRFPSSNHETNHIDCVMFFTPSILLRTQSNSQN
jgi:hypothetical protein